MRGAIVAMKRPMKKYVEKFEAQDLVAGLGQTRSLKRQRYKQKAFIDYLDAYQALDLDAEQPWPDAYPLEEQEWYHSA